MLAVDSATKGDRENGDKLGKISYILSAVGIAVAVVGAILFGIIYGIKVSRMKI